MTHLIDTSSIFEAINTQKIAEITNYSTLDIAPYEIGNVLWKHTHLFKNYSVDQALEMQRLFSDIFQRMRLLNIVGHEEEILKLSLRLQFSFYDSAYLHMARVENLPLISEDRQMGKKCREIGLECYSINEV